MLEQKVVFMLENIVILTGAGISAESGIPVFRSETGLWEEHKVDDVATPEGYERDPELVRNFYNTLRANLKKVAPNPAHLALAELQKKWKNGRVTIVTQNIDDLHERAGSVNILHMHGELLKQSCYRAHGGCGRVFDILEDQKETDQCPVCHRTGTLRPHIVWFGEMPLYMDQIANELKNADLFISIGTSGVVYPAAGFVSTARSYGVPTVEFNLEPSATKGYFDYGVYGKAGTTLPKFVSQLLESEGDFEKLAATLG